MRITYDPIKEVKNKRRHGLSFAIAEYLVEDPLLVIVYGRCETESTGIMRSVWLAVGASCLSTPIPTRMTRAGSTPSV